MKGWLHCGIWKTLASPQLTDVKVCGFSSLFFHWRQTLSSGIKCPLMWHTSRWAMMVRRTSKTSSNDKTECIYKISSSEYFSPYRSFLSPLFFFLFDNKQTTETCRSPKLFLVFKRFLCVLISFASEIWSARAITCEDPPKVDSQLFTLHLRKKWTKDLKLCPCPNRLWNTLDLDNWRLLWTLAVREGLLGWVLRLHRTHFVFWDRQLSKWATVGWRIVRPGWRSATHRDARRNGRHFSCLTLCSNPRSLGGLVQVAVWDGPHAGEELD